MDWSQDNCLYDARVPSNVFKYDETATTVVRLVPGLEKPLIWTLKNTKDWNKWFETEHPALDGSASGLVLILARRNGERDFPTVERVRSDKWLEVIRNHETEKQAEQQTCNKNGQRTLRTLPFSRDSFHAIVKKFYVHGTIAHAISRADIPTFSAVGIEMGPEDDQKYPSFVYNCRTSNAWEGDLALTATYFPHCRLTFAIMFGCPISTEKQVLQRLGNVRIEADHPLLMPGILVELERRRHVYLVEETINELETRILEIDMVSQDREFMSNEEKATRIQAKRAAWLDTMYLCNQLSNWIVNLEKILSHTEELNHTIFRMPTARSSVMARFLRGYGEPQETFERVPSQQSYSEIPSVVSYDELTEGSDAVELGEKEEASLLNAMQDERCEPQQGEQLRPREYELQQLERGMDQDQVQEVMQRTGNRIKNRLRDMIDEYQEKVRDCTTRVEGMALATQWAQGEINLEIAIAANSDSRHMRSIAIITMIFLPGTFFASIFSMGFFDWGAADHAPVVSEYFWIYALLSISFTIITLSIWWYLGVYRHSKRKGGYLIGQWLSRVKARIFSSPNRADVESPV